MKENISKLLEEIFTGSNQIKCLILDRLCENESIQLSVLAQSLGRARSWVNTYAEELADIGLVRMDREGKKTVNRLFEPSELENLDAYKQWSESRISNFKENSSEEIKNTDDLLKIYNSMFEKTTKAMPIIIISHNNCQTYDMILPELKKGITKATESTDVCWVAPRSTADSFRRILDAKTRERLLLFLVDDSVFSQINSAATVVQKNNVVIFSNLIAGERFAILFKSKEFANNYYYIMKTYIISLLHSGMIVLSKDVKNLENEFSRFLSNCADKNAREDLLPSMVKLTFNQYFRESQTNLNAKQPERIMTLRKKGDKT